MMKIDARWLTLVISCLIIFYILIVMCFFITGSIPEYLSMVDGVEIKKCL